MLWYITHRLFALQIEHAHTDDLHARPLQLRKRGVPVRLHTHGLRFNSARHCLSVAHV